VFCFVRGHAQRAEAQWRPEAKAGQLPAFRYFHFVLPPREEGLARTLAKLVEGSFSVTESAARSSTKPGMARKYQYQREERGSHPSTQKYSLWACHNASLIGAKYALNVEIGKRFCAESEPNEHSLPPRTS